MQQFYNLSYLVDTPLAFSTGYFFSTLSILALIISIEANELLECFQWNDNEYNVEDVKEELADVMNYCIQMAQVLNVDIIDIINAKMDKVEKKYPVEKAKGVSTKYNKL